MTTNLGRYFLFHDEYSNTYKQEAYAAIYQFLGIETSKTRKPRRKDGLRGERLRKVELQLNRISFKRGPAAVTDCPCDACLRRNASEKALPRV